MKLRRSEGLRFSGFTVAAPWLAALTLAGALAPAQGQPTFSLPLRSGPLTMTAARFDLGKADYAILQFDHALGARQIEQLRRLGVAPLHFVYDNAWICRLRPGALSSSVAAAQGIVAAQAWQAQFKLAPRLAQRQYEPWAVTREGKLKLLVTFFEDIAPARILAILRRHAAAPRLHAGPQVWAVEVSTQALDALAAEPGVLAIDPGPAPFQPTNDASRALLGVDTVQLADLGVVPPRYDGLSGRGVNVAISESSSTRHPDFMNHDASGAPTTSRFLNPSNSVGDAHGTHVAGTIGGNGWNSSAGINDGLPYQWRGMAPEASLINGYGYNSYPVHVSNHSYVMSFGTYACSYSCPASVDRDVRGGSGLAYQRPHVWAAANQGSTAQYDNEEGYYSIYAPAKNSLAVGALNTNDGSLTVFSSLGPTFDGRIKPDLVAGGCSNNVSRDVGHDQLLSVQVDYIRIYDANATQPTPQCAAAPLRNGAAAMRCWEFSTPGDLEGWFATEWMNIIDPQVGNGLLSFKVPSTQGAFGFVQGVGVTANETQFIEMNYRVDLAGASGYPTLATFLWRRQGSSSYIDGIDSNNTRADGNFRIVSSPVGALGMELDANIMPTGQPGWTGVISDLRLDPLGSMPVISTAPKGGSYAGNCGTSMAAPSVTGTVALLLQQYQRTKGVNLDSQPPLPSTLKAVLVETATDLVHTTADARDANNPDTGAPALYHAGPDFATGFGLVNAPAAIALIGGSGAGVGCNTSAAGLICESSLTLAQREAYELNLAPGVAELKVTLAWDDFEGSSMTSETTPKLVNDLDLVLVDPQGGLHYAWTLAPLPVASCGGAGPGCGDRDPIAPSDVKPAYRARDHLNNVELASVSAPMAGKWRVLVEGFKVQSGGAQAYSLVTTQALVKRSLPAGDLNGDACVDRRDLSLLMADIGGSAPHNGSYDLNGDGQINVADARWLAAHFSLPGGAACP